MTQKHRSISLIVIHCSATRVTQDFTFEQLEACHLARGFKSIGYHYYITKDGVVYPGRPESEVGAHARHYNAHSIGICYEGGLDKNGKPADTRTPAQNQALYSLLESLCLSYPDAEILRKVNTKKRQNRHLPELAFLILGTYFTAPFLFLFIIKIYYKTTCNSNTYYRS